MKDVEFWKKKFADSLTQPLAQHASSSECTSFTASYDLGALEPHREADFFCGDICSLSPLKDLELCLTELRLNDYKVLRRMSKISEIRADTPPDINIGDRTIPNETSSQTEKNKNSIEQTYSEISKYEKVATLKEAKGQIKKKKKRKKIEK